MPRRLVAALLALTCLATAAACSSGTDGRGSQGSTAAPTSASAPSTAATSTGAASSATTSNAPPSSVPPSSPSPSSTTAADRARAAYDRMTPAERVGQLFMVDCPTTSVPAATVAALRQQHVGAVILDGTSRAGLAATQQVTAQLRGLAAGEGARLFIATDQEGGLVQRLQGPGFSTIPSGVDQGGLAPDALRSDAAGWGRELRAAGVNVDLAPVLDVVPAGFGSNPPIGDLDRQYGSTPAAVTEHGLAFARGLADAGIAATVKHFPGLGRTRGNTDTTSGVTDDVTTVDDPFLAPFRAAARAGVPFLMVSTAIYSRIDPGVPAVFSRRIVTGLARQSLGFRGILVTDDLGNATQVSGYGVGERAVRFLAAGGTMVLTVDATQTATMTAAVLARAAEDPAFRRQVQAAALLVLQTKAARGLLP